VIAVIGPGWLAADRNGRRRFDDADDEVRRQLESAFARDVLIIPALVAGAPMPRSDELPESLAGLARRHALELADASWRRDVATLVATLERRQRERRSRLRIWISYRRGDADAHANRLFDELVERFGPEQVFASVDAIAHGAPLRDDFDAWLESLEREEPEGFEVSTPDEELRMAEPARRPGWWSRLRRRAAKGRDVDDGRERQFVRQRVGRRFPDGDERAGESVDCTVFARPAVAPSELLFVQVFAHLAEEVEEASRLATEFDAEAERRAFKSLEATVERGSKLTFDLVAPPLRIPDPVQSLVWSGRPESIQFEVGVPRECPSGTVVGTVTVAQASIPVGHIKFKLRVDPALAASAERSTPAGDDARRYELAFVSYASSDREKVLARVQMLAAVGIRYFQDVLDLGPGERWERSLYRNIDLCDLFLLFWSSAAKRSTWVRKEVEYALARKRGDEFSPPEIRPVIIEGPPVERPWEELAELHFDDRLLYLMAAEAPRS
jgi:hypothetical protein